MSKAVIAAAALAVCAGAQSPLGPSGPNSYLWPIAAGGNGHVYEPVLVPAGVTWNTAFAAAEAAGGVLATVTDAAENAFVFSLVGGSSQFWNGGWGPWLGGFQPLGSAEPAGGWRWVTSEPWTYASWASGEPNNNCANVAERRLSYRAPNNVPAPLWNDMPDAACLGAAVVSYVVEYDPMLACPCTPSGVGAANGPPSNVCPGFTLCAAHDVAGSARLQMFGLPAGTSYGKVLMSTVPMPAAFAGSGPVFGLNLDPLLMTIIFLPYNLNDPFSWIVAEPGIYPQAPFLFPSGTMTPFAGTAWDLVAIAVVTTPTFGFVFSNYVQNTW